MVSFIYDGEHWTTNYVDVGLVLLLNDGSLLSAADGLLLTIIVSGWAHRDPLVVYLCFGFRTFGIKRFTLFHHSPVVYSTDRSKAVVPVLV